MKFINLILALFCILTVVTLKKYEELEPADKKEVDDLRLKHKVICPKLECMDKPIGKIEAQSLAV